MQVRICRNTEDLIDQNRYVEGQFIMNLLRTGRIKYRTREFYAYNMKMIFVLCLQARHKHVTIPVKSVCLTKGAFQKGY